ncbi:hypothetical protein BDW71DRAFT_180549 [Aspergillus fruticulosus]
MATPRCKMLRRRCRIRKPRMPRARILLAVVTDAQTRPHTQTRPLLGRDCGQAGVREKRRSGMRMRCCAVRLCARVR